MKPNIVIVVADDMGYGDVGVYGDSGKIPTPHTDRLAAEGIRFTDMHASASVCTPSRYSLLTGRYCWRTWLRQSVLGGFGAPLIQMGQPTLPSFLRERGYRTGIVGKWHLGLKWYTTNGTPLRDIKADGWGIDGFEVDYERGFNGGPLELGFCYWFGMAGSLDMPPYCFLENRNPTQLPIGEKKAYQPQQRRGLISADWTDYDVDLRFTQKGREFIERHHEEHPDQPFFLYVATSAPHRPCLPPDHIRGRSHAGLRGDMVSMVDWVVGELRTTLESIGEFDNTMFVVTSDHGARCTDLYGKDHRHRANGPFRGQKGDIYEGGHRVPFIVRLPQVTPTGEICSEPLGSVDLFATIADLTDSPLLSGMAKDSRSFYSLLRGEAVHSPVHEALIHHAMDGMFAIRSGPWKLITGTGSGGMSEPRRYTPEPGTPSEQLYNLDDDLGETLNLFERSPDIADSLSTLLSRYRSQE